MRLLIPLFSPVTGTWGGLTRVTALAEAAKRAGHEIAFCAGGSLKLALLNLGYQVYSLPATTLFNLPAPLSSQIEKRSQIVPIPVKPGREVGNIWFVLMLSGMASSDYLQHLVIAEESAAGDFAADAIFTDFDPGAFLVARITGLPVAAAYQTPMDAGIGSLPWRIMNRAVNRVLRSYGLPGTPVQTLFHGPEVLKLVPSIPELEDLKANRADVCYLGGLIGSIQPAHDFELDTQKSSVFVYLGTGSVSLIRAREVLPQVFPAGGDTLCWVGAQSILRPERIGNVEFRPYIPADQILPHCTWTICHGGQNSIIQSLQNHVPLLIFPGPIFERRYNARKVQQNGAGWMGEIPDFSPDWLRENMALRESCLAGAAKLGASIDRYGGADAGIRAIENWVRTRK